MAVTQRPATEAALSESLPTDAPGWRHGPSWFVFGDRDLIIAVAAHRFMAERAGARDTCEITGRSHAVSASQPEAVACHDPRRRRRAMIHRPRWSCG
jgi:pimeloyl-ACP methyl ester carboxylesterase